MSQNKSNRLASSGFTLVELLAVIAIIGILIAMLLPAVQMVRESARRTTCSNNVRQITLATLNFESSLGYLPNGINSESDPNMPSATWLCQILPFIDQNNVWRNAVTDYERSRNPLEGHRGLQRVVNSMVCPSDANSLEAHFTEHEGQSFLVASTNYLGVNGTNYVEQDGVFFSDSSTRVSTIRDGLSNTLMIGERPPSVDYWYGWWYAGRGQEASGSPDMVLGVREINIGGPKLEDCPYGPYSYGPNSNNECDTLHFWSYHPNGGNFSLADGSVHFVSYDGDSVLPALSTIAGGENASILEF